VPATTSPSSLISTVTVRVQRAPASTPVHFTSSLCVPRTFHCPALLLVRVRVPQGGVTCNLSATLALIVAYRTRHAIPPNSERPSLRTPSQAQRLPATTTRLHHPAICTPVVLCSLLIDCSPPGVASGCCCNTALYSYSSSSPFQPSGTRCEAEATRSTTAIAPAWGSRARRGPHLPFAAECTEQHTQPHSRAAASSPNMTTFQAVNTTLTVPDPPTGRGGEETTPTTPRPNSRFFPEPKAVEEVRAAEDPSVKTPTRNSFGGMASQRPLPSSPFTPSRELSETPSNKSELSRRNSHRSTQSVASQHDVDMAEGDEDDKDGSDNESVTSDTNRPSKKKKGQRFFCTEFPPCNLSFTRSEHLARHIRYVLSFSG
jgi:hypothetical protein